MEILFFTAARQLCRPLLFLLLLLPFPMYIASYLQLWGPQQYTATRFATALSQMSTLVYLQSRRLLHFHMLSIFKTTPLRGM